MWVGQDALTLGSPPLELALLCGLGALTYALYVGAATWIFGYRIGTELRTILNAM